jgi:hypothetical protein
VPHLALLMVMASGLASLAALLGAPPTSSGSCGWDTMMATVHGEAQAAIKAFYSTATPPQGAE